MPPNTPPQPGENSEQNENSELEGKIQKWKSLYRNEKPIQDESDGSKSSGNLPGLKEAHKQLSLENYKLKKAYSDIQKQLDLMKVMSWYRRAQVEKLRQNDQLNMSHVVGMLKRELQYLEEVYFREKRLADMWRNEEKERAESSPNTWKYFKDRWNKKYKGEEMDGVCTDNEECQGETWSAGDASGSTKETEDGTSGTPTTEDSVFSDYAGEPDNMKSIDEKIGEKGDFGRIDEDPMQSNQDEMKQREKLQDQMEHGNLLNEKDNLFWRHLRLAQTVEDDLKDIENDGQVTSPSSPEEIPSGDQNEETSNDDGEPNVTNEQPDVVTNNENSSRRQSDWFTYEIVETDNHTIIAYENVDRVQHVLYGFLNGEFREIESDPGDIFVVSMKSECFNVNSSFVVSLLNNSPKPVQFFALLPNGKVKHQRINEHVKVIMVASKDGEESEAEQLIYDATVMEDGKLKVVKQNDDGENIDEYLDEAGKYNEEYSDSKLEVNENHGEESGEDQENDDQSDEENNIEDKHREDIQTESGETSRPNQETPLSGLQPGESFFFDPRTVKMFRRTVSLHQYPISDYETIVAQPHTKLEEVYYRFPGNMIIEKFIVKDKMVRTSAYGNEENAERFLENSAGNTEPVQGIDDVSDTIQQFLQQNTWRYGQRSSILMTYDGTTGIITSIFVTLFKVQPDDIISHDMLKNGRIERIGEHLKVTSYLFYQNQLLRVIREDEIFHSFITIDDEQTDAILNETGKNPGNLKDMDNNSEEEDNTTSDINESSESNTDSYSPANNSQAALHEANEEENQNEECTLRLGDRDTTEYWTYDGATFVHETVERLMPTPNFREEDLQQLDMTTNDIEESVSYIYCDDGSVQKTWRRVEKDVRATEDLDESIEGQNSVGDDDESLHDDYEYDDEEYRDDIDDDHEDIDDKIRDNYNDGEGHDSNDDPDIEDESEDYDATDPIYTGDEINNSDNIDDVDDRHNPEQELENEVDYAYVYENSDNPESIYISKKTQNVDKEDYEMFISREWQNLKLRQQQFEHSRKENMKLQQQMLEEWNKMKEQYKEFQEKFQEKQISELDLEIQGKWNDLKHQQKEFDNMKKDIEDELRKSLKEEWEKLKKKQVEIEMREKQFYKDDETMVRYDEIIGYQMVGVNIPHQQKGEVQVETTLEEQNNYHSETESTSETEEDEMEDNYKEPEEWTCERLNPPWESQTSEESYVDRRQSDAWDLSDSDAPQDTDFEENLPHELPYIPKTDEMSRVDKFLSESWELNEETEEYMTEENLPHEIPYIPSGDNSEMVEPTDNVLQNHEMTETYHSQTNSSATENNEPYITSDGILRLTVHEEDSDYVDETGDEAFMNFQPEDTQPSSQLELQIQKLREELDKLYEAKQSQRNKVQVFKPSMETPATQTDEVQPKCEAKCSETPSDSECPPKCPETDSAEDVSPIYFTRLPLNIPEENSKTQPFPESSDRKEKQSAFSKISRQETKQPSNMEKNKRKRKDLAFMDYVEGHAYLRQLKPEEYDEKMLGLKDGPLAPGKNKKKSKGKFKSESNDKTNSRKERKQNEYLKKETQDRGGDESYKAKNEEWGQKREKNSARNSQKSKRGKQTRKAY